MKKLILIISALMFSACANEKILSKKCYLAGSAQGHPIFECERVQ